MKIYEKSRFYCFWILRYTKSLLEVYFTYFFKRVSLKFLIYSWRAIFLAFTGRVSLFFVSFRSPLETPFEKVKYIENSREEVATDFSLELVDSVTVPVEVLSNVNVVSVLGEYMRMADYSMLDHVLVTNFGGVYREAFIYIYEPFVRNNLTSVILEKAGKNLVMEDPETIGEGVVSAVDYVLENPIASYYTEILVREAIVKTSSTLLCLGVGFGCIVLIYSFGGLALVGGCCSGTVMQSIVESTLTVPVEGIVEVMVGNEVVEEVVEVVGGGCLYELVNGTMLGTILLSSGGKGIFVKSLGIITSIGVTRSIRGLQNQGNKVNLKIKEEVEKDDFCDF